MPNEIPSPGSPEAITQGCLCPRMDNHNGHGFTKDKNGDALYWISGECPLHGQPRRDEE